MPKKKITRKNITKPVVKIAIVKVAKKAAPVKARNVNHKCPPCVPCPGRKKRKPTKPNACKLGIRANIDPEIELPTSNISSIFTKELGIIKTRFKLVEAKDLIASHKNFTGATDPRYALEQDRRHGTLQPREKMEVSTINNLINNIDVKQLGWSSNLINGAPVVGPDNLVEIGNHRAIGLKSLYQTASLNNDELRARAGRSRAKYIRYLNTYINKRYWGLKAADLCKMKEPVLVRERITPLSPRNRDILTQISNLAVATVVTPFAQAKLDAPKIKDSSIQIRENGDLTRNSIIEIFKDIEIPINEQDRYINNKETSDASLNDNGIIRVGYALVSKVFGYKPELEYVFSNMNQDNLRILATGIGRISGLILSENIEIEKKIADIRRASFSDNQKAIIRKKINDLNIVQEYWDAIRYFYGLTEKGRDTKNEIEKDFKITYIRQNNHITDVSYKPYQVIGEQATEDDAIIRHIIQLHNSAQLFYEPILAWKKKISQILRSIDTGFFANYDDIKIPNKKEFVRGLLKPLIIIRKQTEVEPQSKNKSFF